MKNVLKVLSLVLVAVIFTLSLVSCGGPNSDPSKAAAALKENGYTVVKTDADGNILEKGAIALMEAAGVDNISSLVVGTKDNEGITIVYFADTDSAKAELEDIKEYAGEDNECKQSGKMIYYGTEAAIKAAK